MRSNEERCAGAAFFMDEAQSLTIWFSRNFSEDAMIKSKFHAFAAIVVIAISVCGCKPADPPPDLIKTQRAAMNKAKAVEGQLQKQADEQMKAAEEAQK